MPDSAAAPTLPTISRLGENSFDPEGLREFFEYRDLGIRNATHGRVAAHVIRAKPGHVDGAGWHIHELDFQLAYILKGWVRFNYEGVGEVTLKAGDCVYQPPGIRHREIEHSQDIEILEIVMPADFDTKDAIAPK